MSIGKKITMSIGKKITMSIGKKIALSLLAFAFPLSSQAVPVAYTNPTDFFNQLSSWSTLDFEPPGQTAPTTVNTGDTIEGITFTHSLADFGFTMEITDGTNFQVDPPPYTPFDTTSGSNFLGTNDLDVFLDGDSFGLEFGPSNAIGMYFISGDTMYDDDITITINKSTPEEFSGGIVAGDDFTIGDGVALNDGGVAYFLGIVDITSTFTLAEIVAFGGDPDDSFFTFNVDDITVGAAQSIPPIPIPGAVWLFASGLIGILTLRKKAAAS